MFVNFFFCVLVEGMEFVEEVFVCGFVVIGGVMVIGKVMFGDRVVCEFFVEKIYFVQEQNEG